MSQVTLDSLPINASFVDNTPTKLRVRKPRATKPRKRGAPRKEISGADLRTVLRYAAKGVHEYTLAGLLHMDPDTFCARKKDTPKLVQAIQRGRAKWHDDCVARLTKHAEKSFVPDLFVLKSRFGYNDNGNDSDAQRPMVNIVLPATLTPQQWLERRKILALDAPALPQLERVDD